MRRVVAFLTSMDARAWRSLGVSFVLFGGIGVVILVVGPALGLSSHAGVARWLAAARGPWALLAAVAAFALLAFLGAPQVVLIAAAVVVFGPWLGSLYSWIGTFVSSLIGFELGRAFGGRLIGQVKSPGLERFLGLVAKNGLMASLLIRLAPAAPFIVVNAAAGTAGMRRADFAIGTAIGIVPKILLTAFAGDAFKGVARSAGLAQIALLIVALALWLAAAYAGRRWLRAREANIMASPADPKGATGPGAGA